MSFSSCVVKEGYGGAIYIDMTTAPESMTWEEITFSTTLSSYNTASEYPYGYDMYVTSSSDDVFESKYWKGLSVGREYSKVFVKKLSGPTDNIKELTEVYGQKVTIGSGSDEKATFEDALLSGSDIVTGYYS